MGKKFQAIWLWTWCGHRISPNFAQTQKLSTICSNPPHLMKIIMKAFQFNEVFVQMVTNGPNTCGGECKLHNLYFWCKIQNLENFHFLHMKNLWNAAFFLYFSRIILPFPLFWGGAFVFANFSTFRKLEVAHHKFLDQFHITSSCVMKCQWNWHSFGMQLRSANRITLKFSPHFQQVKCF